MNSLEQKRQSLEKEKAALLTELNALNSEIEEREAEIQSLKDKQEILRFKHSNLATDTIQRINYDIDFRNKSLEEIKAKQHFLEMQIEICDGKLSSFETRLEPYIQEEVHNIFRRFLNYIEDNANILAYNVTTFFCVSSIGKHTVNGFIPSGKFGIFLKNSEQPILECCNFDFYDPVYSYDKNSNVVYTQWYTDYEDKFYELFLEEIRENNSVFNDSFIIRVRGKKTFSLELI